MDDFFNINILAMSSESISQINSILNYALIGVFVVLILGLVIALLVGFFEGIFPVAFKLFFILTCFILCFCLLEPTVDAISNFDLSIFNLGYLSFVFENGNQVLVPITTLMDTLANSLAVVLQNTIGFNGSTGELASAAMSLASIILTYALLIIETILISTFGVLISILLYNIIFKHFFAKIGRKTAKAKVVSLFVNGVNYVICALMFIWPLTSIVNIANQAIQNNRPTSDDETVNMVTSFLDTYNNSILAQTLFNWTVNNEGLTIDAQFLDSVLNVSIGEGQESLIGTLNNLANVGGSILDGFVIDGSNITIDLSYLLSESTLINLFSNLNSSTIFTYVLPICLDIALNSELIGQYVDVSLLEISDEDWSKEINNLELLVIDIANSGAISLFIDESGNFKNIAEIPVIDILNKMLEPQSYTYINNAFNRIDDSKLLSRAIPAVIGMLATNNEQLSEILPTSIAELNAISWGSELSIIYDSLYRLNNADPKLLETIVNYWPTSSTNPVPYSTVLYADNNEEETSNANNELINVIVKNISAIKSILIGDFDSDGNLLNCDENGITKVYNSGQQIPNRHYTLFDTNLFKYLAPNVFDLVLKTLENSNFDIDINQADETIDSLLQGSDFRLKVKEEFNSIIDTAEQLFSHESVVDLINQSSNNQTPDVNILENEQLVHDLQEVLPSVDNSKILSSVIKPIVENMIFSNSQVNDVLNSVGLSSEDLNLDVDNFGQEVSNLLNIFNSADILNIISDTSLTDTERIAKISENYVSIANLLDTLFESQIINPKEEFYDNDLNNNYFTLLNFIFEKSNNGQSLINGFQFKEDIVGLNPVSVGVGEHSWANTRENGQYILDMYGHPVLNGENGYIALVIASLGIKSSNVSSQYYGQTIFEVLSNDSDVSNVVGYLESDFKISKVFNAVNDSSVFSASFGDFLDTTLSDPSIGLINPEQGQTFNNVTNWEIEGENFANICNSIQEVGISLTNFDITNVTNVAALNVLLHSLSNSMLFTSQDNYNFNAFIFEKLKTSLPQNLDLLSDPHFDGEPLTYEKAMKDFEIYEENDLYLSNAIKSNWCSNEWILKYSSLSGDELLNAQNDYDFYNIDYISKICKFVNEMNQAITEAENSTNQQFNDISDAFLSGHITSNRLESMLLTLNEIQCLRMPLYHLYDMIKENLSSDKIGFDLSNLNAEYIQQDSTTTLDRSNEISYLVNIYDAVLTLTDNFNQTNIDISNLIEDKNNLVILDNVLVDLNSSYVFHRAGISQYSSSQNDLTAFQTIISQFLKTEQFSQIYYSTDENSKDQIALYHDGKYNNLNEKIEYNLETIFPYNGDKQIQAQEIHKVIEIISSLFGGYKGFENGVSDNSPLYSGLLIDKDGNILDFNSIDITQINIDALKESLYAINDSELLYDCVPNLLSFLFESALNQNDNSINQLINDTISNANPYYVYYVDGDVDFNNHYPSVNSSRKDAGEIENLCNFIFNVSLLVESTSNNNSDLIQLINNDKNIVLLKEVLFNLNDSYIFHKGGSSNGNNSLTTFQGVIKNIFDIEQFNNIYYSEDINSKDQSSQYKSLYRNKSEKLDYNIKQIFDYQSDILTQHNEINNIINSLSSIVGSYKNINEAYIDLEGNLIKPADETKYIGLINEDTMNFNNIDLTDIDTNALKESLYAINDSELLYDCVPNLLSYIFDNSINTSATDEISSLISETISNANPYYVYNINGDINYNNHYPNTNSQREDANEIENLCSFIENIKTIISSSENKSDIFEILRTNNNLIRLDDALEQLNSSYIFHRGGYKLIQVNDELTNQATIIQTNQTTFQSVIAKLVKNDAISPYYFSDDARSKDQNVDYYTDADSKISYYNNLVFSAISDDYESQINEIHNISEIISTLIGSYKNIGEISLNDNFDSLKQYSGLLVDDNNQLIRFDSIGLDNLNGEKFYDTMTAINISDYLYDVAPNMLNYVFNNASSNNTNDDLSSILTEALKNANPYYIYYLNSSSADYQMRFAMASETSRPDYSELKIISEFIEQFNSIFNDYNDVLLRSIFDLENSRLENLLNTFEYILNDLEDSYIFHKGNFLNKSNDYFINRSDNDITTFEYCMKFIYVEIGAGSVIYNQSIDIEFNSANEKLLYNIFKMTYDTYNNNVPILQSNDNYVGSKNWNDEITSFINLIRETKKIMPDGQNRSGSSNNLSDFEMSLNNEKLTPENIYSVFSILNENNILKDAVPNYIQKAFQTMNLEDFTIYNSNVYAQYYFGDDQQVIYDGESGLPTIYQLLKDFAIYDQNQIFTGYIDLSSTNDNDNFLTNYLNSNKSSGDILSFIDNCIIYQNNFDLTLNSKSYESGVDALFIYNIFKSASIDQYINGNSLEEKVLLLDKLLNDSQFDYDPLIEGKAFDTIFNNLTKLFINSSNFDTNDIDSVKEAKNIIVNSILSLTQEIDSNSLEINYDGTPYRHRAYLSSEIMASLLEDIIENEINNISTNGYVLNKENIKYFRADNLGNNIDENTALSFEKIYIGSYDLLNKNEARGLDGILSLYQGGKGTTSEIIQSYLNSNFVNSIKENTNKLEFTENSTKGNSYLASVIYSSRLHDIFETIFNTFVFVNPEIRINDINDLFIYNGTEGIGFIAYGDSLFDFFNPILSLGQ